MANSVANQTNQSSIKLFFQWIQIIYFNELKFIFNKNSFPTPPKSAFVNLNPNDFVRQRTANWNETARLLGTLGPIEKQRK